ncbi:MAG: EAL domain-containing protein [Halopseudomonas sp.]
MPSTLSLRYRFLIPMLIGGLVVTLLGAAYAYRAAGTDADSLLLQEGNAIASSMNHAAMVAHSNAEMQHVIEEVHKDTPQLMMTLIVEGSPARVIASTTPEWIGLLVEQLPDPNIIELLGAETHSDHPHQQARGVILSQLGIHLSQHDHQHSMAVTDHQQQLATNLARQSTQHSAAQSSAPHHPANTEPAPHDHASTPVAGHHDTPTTTPLPVRGKILLLIDHQGADTIALASAMRMASLIGFGILVTLLLSYSLMSTQVLTPLTLIRQTLKKRESGDQTVRAQVNGPAEIAHLASTLNTMLMTIGNNEKELQQLLQAVEQSPSSIIITDTQGKIEYVNPTFLEITGYERLEVIGNTPALVKSGKTTEQTYRSLWDTINRGEIWHGELQNKRKNGELYWEHVSISPILDKQNRVTQFLAIKEDITVRKSYEERLLRQANFDELTGLPNRLLAQDRLSQALTIAQRHRDEHEQVAVLCVDLDDFKKANDTLGHQSGDRILQIAAERLQKVIRKSDTLARFSGDEFMLILPEVHKETGVERVIEKILSELRQPFVVGDLNLFISGSIGIALHPTDGQDAEQLLRNADAAMHRTKQRGGNDFCYFTAEMNQQALELLTLEQELRKAIEYNLLEVHFQPVIDLKHGGIIGAEALVRWFHPELGNVPPLKFIPLAERSELIHRLGRWVLFESCRQAKQWHDSSNGNFRLAVNVSSRQFSDPRLVEDVKQALAESGLPAQDLELEITESLLMQDDAQTLETIRALHQLGIRFAIDDFGTGYSSISYLQKLPFNTLKIDRSFVNGVATNKEDHSLVQSIISLADGLELEVLAEGIEEEEQMLLLLGLGCFRSQGWLFSKALPADQFSERLTSWEPFGKSVA